MPTTLQLFVTLDGVNWPLASCRWVRLAPNGCALGSLLGDTVTTPEAAATEFTPNRRDRQRETRRGIRYQLATPDQWADLKPCLLGECHHQNAHTAA
jgi:hypothetical protein